MPTPTEVRPHADPPAWLSVASFAALTLAGIALYWRALGGGFFGDDLLYTLRNPWVRDASASHLWAILDPFGEPARYVTNFAPVHLLAHALELKLFGDWMPAYHAINVAVHSAGSVLLAIFFHRRGLSASFAAAAALLFFVHPVNVEAVAWITQLKTTLSFALCISALLLFDRHLALSALVFALALLTKATAAIALPVALVTLGCEWHGLAASERRSRCAALTAWTALFLLFAISQALAFRGANAEVAPIAEGLWEMGVDRGDRGRYLWMALSSLGLSTYHEPEAVRSLADARLWLSLAAIAVIAWRACTALFARSNEAVFWAFAVGSFAPVSQIFPFLYPLADRYLYFMLPGLLGACAWMLRSALAAAPAEWRQRLQWIALVGFAGMAIAFSLRTHQRAEVWSDPARILGDAAENYPQGIIALGLEARTAMSEGRVDASLGALRAAMARGFEGLEQLLIDPVYRQHRGDPRLEALLQELATLWVERLAGRDGLTQMEWRQLARAQLILGDANAARESYRAGLRQGGPLDDAMRSELQALVRRVRSDGLEARP